MHQGFQQLPPIIDRQLPELSAIKADQKKLLSGQQKVILHSTQQLQKSTLVRQQPLKLTRDERIAHNRTQGKLASGNQKVIDVVSSKFEELRVNIASARSTAVKSNREIHFIGQSRDAILSPLLLMKDHMEWGSLHLLSHHIEQISPQHVCWLQSEFENLVSSATQEAASFYRGSTATSFDQWVYSTRGHTCSSPATALNRAAPMFKDSRDFHTCCDWFKIVVFSTPRRPSTSRRKAQLVGGSGSGYLPS